MADADSTLAGQARQLIREWDAAMSVYSDAAMFVAHQPSWLLRAVIVLRAAARARPDPAVPAYTVELDGTENFGRANPADAS